MRNLNSPIGADFMLRSWCRECGDDLFLQDITLVHPKAGVFGVFNGIPFDDNVVIILVNFCLLNIRAEPSIRF
jgi:hypothetical protein